MRKMRQIRLDLGGIDDTNCNKKVVRQLRRWISCLLGSPNLRNTKHLPEILF